MALAGGALWGLCFSVQPWLPLCAIGLVPLLLLLSQPRAWLLGWLHGFATWAVALPWPVETLPTYGGIAGWLAALLLLRMANAGNDEVELHASLLAACGQQGIDPAYAQLRAELEARS